MVKYRTKILAAGIVAVIAMLLFPPFKINYANGMVTNMGYHFLLDPPFESSGRMVVTASVDYGMLFVQWAGVLIAVGLGLQLTKETTTDCK